MYKRLNILASFAFMHKDGFFQNLLEAMTPYANILIDSGAFSNHQNRMKRASGHPVKLEDITLEDYVDYLKRKAHGKVWQYITLDVIQNKKATEANLQMLLDAGLTPMPVYITGHEEKDLAHLLAINKRICVAGGVGSHGGYILRRYKSIYELSNQQARIHGLGYGRWPGTFHADLASCDSSSFNYGSRYGILTIYQRDKGFDNFHWKQLDANSPKPGKRAEFIAHLSYTFGLTTQDLLQPETYKGKNSYLNLPTVTGTLAYLDFMAHVQEYGKDYFIAAPTYGFIFALVAVAAARGTDNFSHKTIGGFYQAIDAAYKTSRDKSIEVVQSFLEKYTQWQILPHSL